MKYPQRDLHGSIFGHRKNQTEINRYLNRVRRATAHTPVISIFSRQAPAAQPTTTTPPAHNAATRLICGPSGSHLIPAVRGGGANKHLAPARTPIVRTAPIHRRRAPVTTTTSQNYTAATRPRRGPMRCQQMTPTIQSRGANRTPASRPTSLSPEELVVIHLFSAKCRKIREEDDRIKKEPLD